MTNRYAQMEAESNSPPAGVKNRYAYMEMQQRKGKKSKQGDLKRDYAWRDVPGAALGAVKQDVVDVATSVKNAYHKPAEAAEKAYQATENIKGNVKKLGSYVVNNKVDSAKAVMNAALGIPAAVGEYLGENYGDEGSIKRSLAEHPYRSALDVATIATLPAAVPGQVGTRATQVVPRAARYAASPGLAVNDVAAAAARGVGSTTARVADTMNPTSAMVARNLEGRGPEVLASLRNPQMLVPGSVPTTAQAASTANAPRFVAVAKAAEKRNPAAHLDLLNAQHRARAEHLRSIVGGNPDLVAHKNSLLTKRSNDRARDYGVSDPMVVQTDKGMYDILERPLNSNVVGEAELIAASVPRPFDARYTPAQPAQVIPDPFGQNIPPTIIPAKPAVYPKWTGRDVDLVKKAFDDIVFKGRTATSGGLGPEQIRVIRDNREDFLRWAHSVLPEYTDARANFAATSKDIDRTNLVKYLEDRLQSPTMGEDTINPRADVFSNAVREAAGANPVVNAATGEKRFSNLSDRFNSAQMKVIENIQDDMSRAKLADAQGVLGNRYNSEVDAILTEALGFSPNNALARTMMGPINRHLGDKAAQGLSSTESAAKMVERAIALEQAKARGGRMWSLAQKTNAFINPYRYANRYPMLYNTLADQQQTQSQPR